MGNRYCGLKILVTSKCDRTVVTLDFCAITSGELGDKNCQLLEVSDRINKKADAFCAVGFHLELSIV